MVQAESVAHLVAARTAAAADSALAGLAGGLSTTILLLRKQLLTVLAQLEVPGPPYLHDMPS